MTRLQDVREAIENGEPVDYRRVSSLIALDAAVAAEDYAAESEKRQREADEHLGTRLGN